MLRAFLSARRPYVLQGQVDLYNRQLHPEERILIANAANAIAKLTRPLSLWNGSPVSPLPAYNDPYDFMKKFDINAPIE